MTAMFFLIGSMAISALPPFNGFFSEWFTYQSLFLGAMTSNLYVRWVFLIAIVALALTGGLAMACFVKAFGVTFLARARSAGAKAAKEVGLGMRIAMGGLAALCVLLGMSAASVIGGLESVAAQMRGTQTAGVATLSRSQILTVSHGFASIWPLAIVTLLIGVPVLVWMIVRYMINRRQRVTTSLTWDCGTDMTGRMEITGTGFARSIVSIFHGILKPTIQHEVEYSDAASRYLPKSRFVAFGATDIYEKYSYGPIYNATHTISRITKRIQNGNVNTYVMYIFIVLVITLLVAV
jgi:hydrogenase-4 component B